MKVLTEEEIQALNRRDPSGEIARLVKELKELKDAGVVPPAATPEVPYAHPKQRPFCPMDDPRAVKLRIKN